MAYINGNYTTFGNAFFDVMFLKLVDKSIVEAKLDEVEAIGKYAFAYCADLEVVELPNVLTIDNNAFYNCTSLEEITLQRVTSIAGMAFSGCTALETVYIFSKPTLASTNAFPSATIIRVPEANKTYFQGADNWSTLFNNGKIKPLSGEWA